MSAPALFAALALAAGTFMGSLPFAAAWPPVWLVPLVAAAAIAWWMDASRLVTALVAAICFGGGLVLAAYAREAALDTPLRRELHEAFGGFDITSAGPGGRHDPVPTRGRLLEDGFTTGELTTVRVAVEAIQLDGEWRPVTGGVTLSVSGAAVPRQLLAWVAGRRIEAPVSYRRPSRYLNDGVTDFEAALARGGTTLFGTVKSALLVQVIGRGNRLEEFAARIRADVRRSITRWVAPHDPVSAGIVTAVLIGDRSGLPADVRLRLQAAGTYHVIAISGGNIAILTGLILAIAIGCGASPRTAAAITIALLLMHSFVVTSGASVWRATLMAVLYLAARIVDHRTAPWQAIGVAGVVVLCVSPLDIRDIGFVLTFAATAALLECTRRIAQLRWPRAWQWAAGAVAVSVAAEIALLPVNAWTFSRVTAAGLVLNLLAVPMMAVVQVAGLVIVVLQPLEPIARSAGLGAHLAASSIVESARVADLLPWLVRRIPPPAWWIVVAYYAGLGLALAGPRRLRQAGGATAGATAILIVSGSGGLLDRSAAASPPGVLRVTVFDVGQGDSVLLQLPGGRALLVDAGGSPFGNGSFDIGARVLAPALWARGIHRLDTLVLTHGDPDHAGGAVSVTADFRPAAIWQGVDVPGHAVVRELRARAPVLDRRGGDVLSEGGVRIRVLHPPEPDWERVRVRNDDSIVLEVVYGGVALLLPGDISATVERQIAPLLTPARVRILKAAHHGSRTSTSAALIDVWRPTVALISAGRGNTFGHPHPDVIARLQAAGAAIYRTDRDGQITLRTDGRQLSIDTYVGGNDVYR